MKHFSSISFFNKSKIKTPNKSVKQFIFKRKVFLMAINGDFFLYINFCTSHLVIKSIFMVVLNRERWTYRWTHLYHKFVWQLMVWYFVYYIPTVLAEGCRILILDNCSVYSRHGVLCENNVYATHLPPNCAFFIQHKVILLFFIKHILDKFCQPCWDNCQIFKFLTNTML